MYVPKFNAITDRDEIQEIARSIGSASLITVGKDGYPLSTLLPIIWGDDRIITHMAIANGHWKQITPASPCLLVANGHEAYISPNWYAAKAEHGRVVPTWNYESVQIRGKATVHHDPDWLREAVTRLTDLHEARFEQPWHVTDAPEAYITGQLRGIVGVEIAIEEVAAKSKMSQNRSHADRSGVTRGLRATGLPQDEVVSQIMECQPAELNGDSRPSD